jgi:Collagen triple helix repeat (20 copies)
MTRVSNEITQYVFCFSFTLLQRTWSCNFSGPFGVIGGTGAVGGTGATGLSGPAGSPGFPGQQGQDGFVGSTGQTGNVGATGPTGYPGQPGKVFAYMFRLYSTILPTLFRCTIYCFNVSKVTEKSAYLYIGY